MDALSLFDDYNIPYSTEGKHHVEGWINIQCPFCDDSSTHLGYNLFSNYFHCWKCGWHPNDLTFSKLIGVSVEEVKKIIKSYGLTTSRITKEPEVKIRLKAYRMPSGTGPLQERHIKYLESRNFDAKKLERTWNLVGTGPMSLLDGLDYKLRIIVPIIWDSQAVSFTGRDITNKNVLRYRACPGDRELVHHKHILYGSQDRWKDRVVLVEGPTDVWRFGINSCAVFGIQYTHIQVRLLANTFRQVAVCFDNDSQAAIQAGKVVAELKFRGVDAFKVDIVGDPGGMKQEDADYLVKQLI